LKFLNEEPRDLKGKYPITPETVIVEHSLVYESTFECYKSEFYVTGSWGGGGRGSGISAS
jgi:hypothetical protein